MIGNIIVRQGGRTLVPRLDQAVQEIGKEINVKNREAPEEEVREFRVEEDNWNKWNAAKLEEKKRKGYFSWDHLSNYQFQFISK
jgi:hypothetical protein